MNANTVFSVNRPIEKGGAQCQRRQWLPLLAAVFTLLFLLPGPKVVAQTCGAANLAIDGTLEAYQNQGSDGNSNPTDQYAGGYYVDNTNTVYDSGFNNRGNVSNFAINADGVTMMNGSVGVVFYARSLGVLSNLNGVPSNVSQIEFWNGSYEVLEVFPGAATYIQAGSSPWYWYDGNTAQNYVLDGRTGWPISNVFPLLPTSVMVNDTIYTQSTPSVTAGGSSYSETIQYDNPAPDSSDYVAIVRNAASGSATTFSVYGMYQGNSFSGGTLDPLTNQVSGVPVPIAFQAVGGTPANASGIQWLSWDNNLLSFYGTDPDGADVYWSAGSGTGDYTVYIAADGSATAVDANGTFSGSWTFGLTFPANAGTADLLWIDSTGQIWGLPASGVTLYFGAPRTGQSLMLSNGSTANPDYLFRLPDGTWGVEYSGAHLANGPILVQDDLDNDSLGKFTSPPYAYSSASSSFYNPLINGKSGWQSSTIYPSQLYVNGILCAALANSQFDSGGGLPRNGGTSYYNSQYDLTVVLSWSWDVLHGFQGIVKGKYGQSSNFSGTWDGITTFSNVTNGALVTVDLQSGPYYGGPEQVTVNGAVYKFNPQLTNWNSDGQYGNADYYTDGLGNVLVVNSSAGQAYYTPAGGSTITGTYSSNTHQFAFGSGTSLTAVATDAAGHGLSTSSNGSGGGTIGSSGGTTTISGSLDIGGNTLTLGTWIDGGGTSVNGFSLLYTDGAAGTPGWLSLSSTRAQVNWIWSHPTADEGTTLSTAMELDKLHTLQLFYSDNSGTAGIVLNPSGDSGFHGPLRVNPQGDIDMGDFRTGTKPPGDN